MTDMAADRQHGARVPIELFRGVVTFVAAAEAKSFRRAAVDLGISAAAVSKAVAALEDETGVKLFVRGAREVTLTSEGEAFLAHCRPAVVSVTSGRAALESRKKQPQGELVISAPYVAAPLVAPVVAVLRERHPKLGVALRVTDRLARLGEEGVDVALRVGALDASGLVARKVRSTRLVTVASPQYLARAGRPASIDALVSHACVGAIGPKGKPFEWWFRTGPREIRSAVLSDFGPALVDAALAGVGITQLFDFMAAPLVREGRLVLVLEEEIAPGPDVFALCAPGRQSSARVRVAMDAFAEILGAR